MIDPEQQRDIEASVFRRLLHHLENNSDVQNIDLMILAGFCRNCLSKWYMASAEDQGANLSIEQAQEAVYGMPYSSWKKLHQNPATKEQLEALAARD